MSPTLPATHLHKHHDPGRRREDAADDGHGGVTVVREEVAELQPRHAYSVAPYRQEDGRSPQVVRCGWGTDR